MTLSDRPLVDHVIFESGGHYAGHDAWLPMAFIPGINNILVLYLGEPNETMDADSENPALFSTTVCCSLVNFA